MARIDSRSFVVNIVYDLRRIFYMKYNKMK
nr:MAG TPA: hypothetical protein [Caudoviricetes sp.]